MPSSQFPSFFKNFKSQDEDCTQRYLRREEHDLGVLRLTDRQMKSIRELVKDSAFEISRRTGYLPD